MKITIVGSMQFYDKYKELKIVLEGMNHKVILPLPNKTKLKAMQDFNKDLEKSDAILVANYDKNGIKNYIGVNGLMEVGMAYNRKRKIFILNKIPDNCKIEFEAMKVTELNGDLTKIK